MKDSNISVCNHIVVDGVTWSSTVGVVAEGSNPKISTKVYHDGELVDSYTSIPVKALKMVAELKGLLLGQLELAIEHARKSVLN